jgi:hypothetical protein
LIGVREDLRSGHILPAGHHTAHSSLYEDNSQITGRHGGQGLGFVIPATAGQIIGGAGGYTWAGISELRQMWIDEAHRRRGYARSDQPHSLQARMSALAYDDVVVDGNSERSGNVDDGLRHLDIRT